MTNENGEQNSQGSDPYGAQKLIDMPSFDDQQTYQKIRNEDGRPEEELIFYGSDGGAFDFTDKNFKKELPGVKKTRTKEDKIIIRKMAREIAEKQIQPDDAFELAKRDENLDVLQRLYTGTGFEQQKAAAISMLEHGVNMAVKFDGYSAAKVDVRFNGIMTLICANDLEKKFAKDKRTYEMVDKSYAI